MNLNIAKPLAKFDIKFTTKKISENSREIIFTTRFA